MVPRPPSDAIVALRSLGRRYRALFAGLGEDDSPDDMAHRAGGSGWSAIDHMAAGRLAITSRARALEHVLVTDDPALEAMPHDESARGPGGVVEEHLAGLDADATHLADRASRVSARDWGRTGHLGDGTPVTAAELLWAAVDAALEHLRSAQRVLDEVRGQP